MPKLVQLGSEAFDLGMSYDDTDADYIRAIQSSSCDGCYERMGSQPRDCQDIQPYILPDSEAVNHAGYREPRRKEKEKQRKGRNAYINRSENSCSL